MTGPNWGDVAEEVKRWPPVPVTSINYDVPRQGRWRRFKRRANRIRARVGLWVIRQLCKVFGLSAEWE